MAYLFRREDNGKLVRVPFDVMMTQDRAGFITLPDGTSARRCVHLEKYKRKSKQGDQKDTTLTPVVSDALGFPQHQLAQFEQDRVKNGFRGVEFVRDPLCKEFFQVKISSRAERERYIRHRGMVDKSSTGGVLLSQEDLDRAAEIASRKSGEEC